MISIIKTAGESDQVSVIQVIVRAFGSDPVARWAMPDMQQYSMHFPSFVKAFGGRAFAHGSAYYADGYTGAALWLPPGVQPDQDALLSIFQRALPEQTRDNVFALFDQMGHYHPSEAHWYLPLIGVDPQRQGKGIGSALMKHALSLCDRNSVPAYLESTNPKNVPLYERHGFELLGKIQAGTSPPLFPMLRKPGTHLLGASGARR